MDLTFVAIIIVSLVVLTYVWNAGADIVVEGNLAVMAKSTETRMLKAEVRDMTSSAKLLSKVEALENPMSSKDALSKLKKMSKEAKNATQA